MAIAESGAASAATPDNTLIIQLATGNVVIEMLPDVAPKHVARIKELAHDHFYDGIVFHRVIPGFMAQTGDPTGTGTGGSKRGNLPAEFSKIPFERGTLGMARSANPEQRRQPVLHLLRPGALAGRPVHGLGQGHAGHGPRRQDREGRAAGEARQDDHGAARLRGGEVAFTSC